MVFLTDIFRKLTLGAPDFLVTWEQKLGARPGPPGAARVQPFYRVEKGKLQDVQYCKKTGTFRSAIKSTGMTANFVVCGQS